jgi:hypothetical protein
MEFDFLEWISCFNLNLFSKKKLSYERIYTVCMFALDAHVRKS